MATDLVIPSDRTDEAHAVVEGVVPPYAPSWIDSLDSWIESRPGPSWVVYVVLIGIFVLFAIVEPSLDGATDPAVWATALFWGIVVPLTLWLFHHLKDVAGSAFDVFRPALAIAEDEAWRMRYVLTVTPARVALVILLANLVFTLVYYFVDPASAAVVGLSPIGMVLRFVSEVLFGALLLTLFLQSGRQLRSVVRTHAAATRVDLFRPSPLYAFSVLTARTAIVIALLTIIPALVGVAGTTLSTTVVVVLVPWMIAGVILAGLVFVVPLRGMHLRIVMEKRRLQTDVGGRIESTMGAIHERIDDGDAKAAGEFQNVMQVLVMERDLVDKLPTLPWRPGTAGAVVSAVVAPLALFVVTQLLEPLI